MEEKEEVKYCLRCHRKLKDDKSRQLGFGPVCYEKQLINQKNYLFTMGVNRNETN